MAVLAQPNHPARLLALFAASLAVCGLIALAAYAGVWIWRDASGGETSRVAGIGALPQDNVKAPEGLMIVIPVDDPAEFEALTGFPPFVPERVPASTDATPKFAVTQPDEEGKRVGRVAFSANPDVVVDGVSGPVVVIAEAQGKPGVGVDGEIKRITSGGRALVSTLACGGLVLDVQLYFSPEPAKDEPVVTPYMRNLAVDFIGKVKEQCARPAR
jgi:hypothetical protein